KPEWVGLSSGRGIEWVLLAAGAALGICGVVFLVAYDLAGRRTAEALEPLQQGAVDAQAHFQSWQKLAKIELARSEQECLARHGAVVERRNRSLAQFTAVRDERVAELESQRAVQLEDAANWRAVVMQAASERYNQQLLTAESANRRETTA